EPADVERYLDEHPGIELVTVVHSETPSGTVCDVSAIGPIAHAHGALTLIDCVSSLGGIPFSTDERQLDVCVAGAQKCLGGPPGRRGRPRCRTPGGGRTAASATAS